MDWEPIIYAEWARHEAGQLSLDLPLKALGIAVVGFAVCVLLEWSSRRSCGR